LNLEGNFILDFLSFLVFPYGEYVSISLNSLKNNLNSGFIRVFQTHSPIVDSIEVKRRGDVRQAKLYYLRELSGRKARIKEKLAKK